MSDCFCLCTKPDDDSTKQNKSGEFEDWKNFNKKDIELKCQEFLMKYLKVPLVSGLNEIILKKPSDPIDFLAEWLLYFQDNQKKADKFEEELKLYQKNLQNLDNEGSDN